MTQLTICKVMETADGIKAKVIIDGKTQYKSTKYQNYILIYEDDYVEAKFIVDKWCTHCVEYTDKDGKLFYKIYLKNNYWRNKLRVELEDEGIQVFEGDITANKRFVIEYPNSFEMKNLRLAFMDIESFDMFGFDKDFKGNIKPSHPILSIAVKEFIKNGNGEEWYIRNTGMDTPQFENYLELTKELLNFEYYKDNINNELMLIYQKDDPIDDLLKEELKNAEKTIIHKVKESKLNLKKWDGAVVSALQTGEEIMLREYFIYIHKYQMVSGWNSQGFDDVMIRGRAKLYGMEYDDMLMINMDYMLMYKNNSFDPAKSFKLNDVAYKELKSALNDPKSKLTNLSEIKKLDWKVATKAKKFFQLFLCYPEFHEQYNLQDVRLLEMMEQELNFFALHSLQCDLSHAMMNDTLYNSRMCDNDLLKIFWERKIVPKTKPNRNVIELREKDKNTGGFTYCYLPGLHWKVSCYDFKAHYLNIIRSFNISAENFIRTVKADLTKLFTEEEIEYINFCEMISKDHLGSNGKIKKSYDVAVENKRLEYDSMKTMEDLMWFFVRNYDQKIEHRDNEVYTPSELNKHTFGWQIQPHQVFSRKERGVLPTILDTISVNRDKLKAERNACEYKSFEYREKDIGQTAFKLRGNCFSLDTDVMTCDGPKNILDIKKGDKVFSMNMKTQKIEEANVIEEIYQEHNGEMIHFKTLNVDLITTPDHRMVRSKGQSNENYFCNASECINGLNVPMHKGKIKRIVEENIYIFDLVNFNDYDFQIFKYGKDLRTIRVELRSLSIDVELKNINSERCVVKGSKLQIKNLLDNNYHVKMRHKRSGNCTFNNCTMNSEDFSKICGWYIADGSIYESKEKSYRNYKRENRNNNIYEKVRGITRKVSIGKYKKSNGRKEIIEILRLTGLNIYEEDNCLGFVNDAWFEILKNFGQYGYKKNIPIKFKKYLNFEILFNAMYMCDGTKANWVYSTTSNKLKDQLKEICFHIGRFYNAKLHKEEKNKDVWKIFCSPITHGKSIQKSGVSKVNGYNKVACITLDKNNTVYAGRNDTFVWTGQSHYGNILFRGSRYYMKQIGNAITTSARYATKLCMILIWDQGLTITHGDSVSGDSKIILENSSKNIETLWEANTNKIIRKGNKELKVWDNKKVLTSNNKFKNIFSKPQHIIRHKVGKQIYRIKLSSGDSIDVTEDHSLIGLEKNKFIEIKPDKVEKILFNAKIPTLDKNNGFSKELLNFLGMLIANGTTDRVRNSIYLSYNHMKEYLKEIISPLSKQYNFSIPKLKKNGFDIQIMSKSFRNLIDDLGFKGNSKSKRIPQWMFEETEQNIIHFLSGYMSGDGTIYGDGKRDWQLKCSSISFELMQDIKRLFELCGIAVSFRDAQYKNTYKGKDTKTTMKELVVINRRDYADKFYFIGKDKQKRMKFLQGTKKRDFVERRIIDIRKLNMKPIYVYDLSVPKYEKFYANGFLVHNTDSSYCKGDKTKEEMDVLFKKMLNEKMKVFNMIGVGDKLHSISFDHEADYKSMIPVKKKRYYYLNSKGIVGGKGGAQTRSDVLQIAQELQLELLEDIFFKRFDKDKWLKKLLEIKNKALDGKLEEKHLIKIQGLAKDIDNYGLPMIDKKTGLQKVTKAGKLRFATIPAHVKMAKEMIEDGEYVATGDKISFIVAKNNPIVPISIKEYRETKNYDHEYYHIAIVKPCLEILLTVYPEITYTFFKDCWFYTKKQLEKLIKDLQAEDEDD